MHDQFPVVNDSKADEMLESVQRFCASPIHAKTNSVIVVIMSHGNDGGVIYGSDLNTITEEAVKRAMTPDNSGTKSHIANKPRILIVAACRGSMHMPINGSCLRGYYVLYYTRILCVNRMNCLWL